MAEPSLANEVERLAEIMAGVGASEIRLGCARRVAEAQVDLLRVRRARSLLLDEVKARAKPPSVLNFTQEYERLTGCPDDNSVEVRADVDDGARAVLCTPNALDQDYQPLRPEEGIELLAVRLARLDRYERRALSRRKVATRGFDRAVSDLLR